MELTKEQKNRVLRTRELFIKDFKVEPADYFQSCGRLEIIGNHVDYNSGCLINTNAGNLNIFASAGKADSLITIKSEGYPDTIVDINKLEYVKSEEETSVALIKGLLKKLVDNGYKIGGLNVEMNSSIYKGGGVSSSASFSVLIGKMISYYYNKDKIPGMTIAKSSRWAENNYFGKGSGLQDQIGCMAEGFAFNDYKDQENPQIAVFPAKLGDYHIFLIDTKTDHAESQGGFQSIVSDMNSISRHFNVKYLNEIPFEEFMDEYAKVENRPQRSWCRAYHFLTEVKRVKRAYKDLLEGDVKSFLGELNDSGLSSEYNLQSIVAEGHKTNNLKECLHIARSILKDGAIRVHGGGFGGTCIVFINKHEEKAFIEEMKKEFPIGNIIPVIINDKPLRQIDKNELGLK